MKKFLCSVIATGLIFAASSSYTTSAFGSPDIDLSRIQIPDWVNLDDFIPVVPEGYPKADGIDVGQFVGAVPEGYPQADGIDLGQFEVQPYDSSYNYDSDSFTVGVYLNASNLVNIQNTPTFTSAKQSGVASDQSVSVSYQIINESSNKITSTVVSGAYVNTDTTVSGFNKTIATGDCRVYLAGQNTTVEKRASGTFNY
jgi:hypothetical protein